MINSHCSIVLDNLAHRYYLSFSCSVFSGLIDWGNQSDGAAANLVFDKSSGYGESKSTAVTAPTDRSGVIANYG